MERGTERPASLTSSDMWAAASEQPSAAMALICPTIKLRPVVGHPPEF